MASTHYDNIIRNLKTGACAARRHAAPFPSIQLLFAHVICFKFIDLMLQSWQISYRLVKDDILEHFK